MSNLSANSFRIYEVGDTNNLPMKASVEIFAGSAVGLTAGYARQLVNGDTFVGFAEGHVNNTVATDGANTIAVKLRGFVQLSVASVAVTDVGADVNATDGNTFVLTAGTFIGKVHRFISTGVCIVAFNVTVP